MGQTAGNGASRAWTTNRRNFLRMGAVLAGVPVLDGLLSACGGSHKGSLPAGDASTKGGATGAAPSSGGAQTSGPKVTSLTIATAETPWLDGYKALISEYEKQTSVQVTLRSFPFAGLRTQMITAVQNSNHAFDVLQINEQWTGEFYNSGWVMPIKSIDSGFALDPQLITYQGVGSWDTTKKVTSDTGTLYALPINGNAQIYYYRKDIFNELGVSPPKTFDDAIKIGKQAKSAGKAKYGYVLRGTNTVSFTFSPILNGYGGDWFVNAGTDWTPRINDDIGVQAMQTYLELLALGPQPAQTVAQSQVGAAMQSGQALQGHSVAALGGQFEDPQKSRVAGNLGYAAMPAGSKRSAPGTGTWVLGVPAHADPARAKAALDFITWLVGKTPMTEWAEQHGGIPTRQDALQSAATTQGNAYLGALADEHSDYVAGFRYTFAAEMIQAIEPPLANIVSGGTPVKKGLDAVASAMAKVVKDAGIGS